MTITSITINSATLGASPGPVLNEGSSTSNSFTINGTGFPGDVTASGITFNFPGYSPAASSIDTLSSIEFAGEFYYDPGATPGGSETQSTLFVTVSITGSSTSYPSSGNYPVKIKIG